MLSREELINSIENNWINKKGNFSSNFVRSLKNNDLREALIFYTDFLNIDISYKTRYELIKRNILQLKKCSVCGCEIVLEKFLLKDYCSKNCANKSLVKSQKLKDKKKERKKLNPYIEMTLEWWIYKYGTEEGTQKYINRCQKVANTKENFIKRHGEEIGLKKYEHLKKACSRSQTLDRQIELYGEKEGLIRRDLILTKKAMTLQNFINRYGLELGTNKYNDMKDAQKVKPIKRFIDSYGLKEGLEKYEAYCKSKAMSEEKFKELYGEKEGIEKYKNWYDNSGCSGPKSIAFSRVYRISKESIVFFDKLITILISIGIEKEAIYHPLIKGKEFSFSVPKGYSNFYDTKNKKYFYDFCIPKYRLIIEYDGSFWHKDKSIDEPKEMLARHMNYVVFRIKDTEVKNDLHNVLKTLTEKVLQAKNNYEDFINHPYILF